MMIDADTIPRGLDNFTYSNLNHSLDNRSILTINSKGVFKTESKTSYFSLKLHISVSHTLFSSIQRFIHLKNSHRKSTFHIHSNSIIQFWFIDYVISFSFQFFLFSFVLFFHWLYLVFVFLQIGFPLDLIDSNWKTTVWRSNYSHGRTSQLEGP